MSFEYITLSAIPCSTGLMKLVQIFSGLFDNGDNERSFPYFELKKSTNSRKKIKWKKDYEVWTNHEPSIIKIPSLNELLGKTQFDVLWIVSNLDSWELYRWMVEWCHTPLHWHYLNPGMSNMCHPDSDWLDDNHMCCHLWRCSFHPGHAHQSKLCSWHFKRKCVNGSYNHPQRRVCLLNRTLETWWVKRGS